MGTFYAILLIYGLALVLILFACTAERKVVSRPRAFFTTQIWRDTMADVLVYKVSVGAPVDADVVERQLVVALNGNSEVDDFKVFSADTTDLGEVRAKQGDKVLLTLVDVDDVGNRSEPAVLEFVAEDTLPPAKPGEFGVTLVKEEAAE